MVKDGLIEEADIASSQVRDDQHSQAFGYNDPWSDQNSPPRRPNPSDTSFDGGDADGDGNETFPRCEEWVEHDSPT